MLSTLQDQLPCTYSQERAGSGTTAQAEQAITGIVLGVRLCNEGKRLISG